MKNARITGVIASLSLLSLLDGCGPSETFADEKSALTCGHEASLLACCRHAFRPGKKRERCMADARHGRGICAHKRHDAGAVDAPGAGDGAADAAGADGPMDAANTDARDTNDSSVDAGPGESCQAASPNDVWMESDPPTFPAAMFATGANDVWMIGGYPTSVFRWDGVTWTSVLAAPSGETFSSIWASAPDDVWVAGTRVRRWNGVVWTDVTPASFVFWGNEALWGTGRDDVWLRSGPQPARLLEWNGSSWTDRSPPPSGIGEVFETSSLWGSAADDVWVVGYYAVNSKRTPSILHWNGLVWAQSPANTVLGAFAGIWGSAANDIWAGASEGMLHYDGTEWQVINGTPGVLGRLAFEERNAPAM